MAKTSPDSPFKDPKFEGEGLAASKLHQVYYFGSKAEFVDVLEPETRARGGSNLGFYDPPKSGRGRVPAYFYRDPDGQIPETATLYHEVSHQLLFETAGPNSYTKNAGNFWVFEGLGTYFETVMPQPDGSLEVGGLVGPESTKPISSLVVQRRRGADGGIRRLRRVQVSGQGSDLSELSASDVALTVFLMQWNQEPTATTFSTTFVTLTTDGSNGQWAIALRESAASAVCRSSRVQFLTFLKDG